jgi:hypothetical protein
MRLSSPVSPLCAAHVTIGGIIEERTSERPHLCAARQQPLGSGEPVWVCTKLLDVGSSSPAAKAPSRRGAETADCSRENRASMRPCQLRLLERVRHCQDRVAHSPGRDAGCERLGNQFRETRVDRLVRGPGPILLDDLCACSSQAASWRWRTSDESCCWVAVR